MDEHEQPTRRPSLLRMLAIALAGGLGAFGAPAGAHAAPTPGTASASAPAVTVADARPE